jgi:hypothetical protein
MEQDEGLEGMKISRNIFYFILFFIIIDEGGGIFFGSFAPFRYSPVCFLIKIAG